MKWIILQIAIYREFVDIVLCFVFVLCLVLNIAPSVFSNVYLQIFALWFMDYIEKYIINIGIQGNIPRITRIQEKLKRNALIVVHSLLKKLIVREVKEYISYILFLGNKF